MTDIHAHSDPWHPIPSNGTRAARRAYAASITGMDRKLGRLLEALKKNATLWQSTVVVLHSDHGFALGEGGQWRKMTNFEVSTRGWQILVELC